MASQDAGGLFDPGPVRHLEAVGMPSRIDREIRRRKAKAGKWLTVTPAEATAYGSRQAGVLLILASHPNGRVRDAAVDVACSQNVDVPVQVLPSALDGFWMLASGRSGSSAKVGDWLRLPGVARMLAQRALDPVEVISSKARSQVRALFESEMQRDPRGAMLTNVEVAARELVARPAAVHMCPGLVDQALDLFASSSPIFTGPLGLTHHKMSATERHRHKQLHHHLSQSGSIDPEQERVRERLVDWHQQALR